MPGGGWGAENVLGFVFEDFPVWQKQEAGIWSWTLLVVGPFVLPFYC